MEPVKEEIKVTVEEVPDMPEEEIMEIKFSINTLEAMEASYTTENINGKLECVIISAESPVEVSISLAEYPEIVLFSDVNFVGTKYLPLRTEAYNEQYERFNFIAAKWALNNKLLCQIRGAKQKEASFVVRWC